MAAQGILDAPELMEDGGGDKGEHDEDSGADAAPGIERHQQATDQLHRKTRDQCRLCKRHAHRHHAFQMLFEFGGGVENPGGQKQERNQQLSDGLKYRMV